MGKRVNLAELAVDDWDPPAPSASQAAAPVRRDEPGPNRVVPIEAVALNPLNKRPAGADDELEEMAETVRVHGVIQPLVVCSTEAYLAEFPEQREAVWGCTWVVLIGNRRLRAARLAPLHEVSIVVNDEQVTSMYEVMLIENGQRKELPPLHEAEAMAEVLKSTSISQRELARRIGKSHVYVTHRLALRKLIPELREAMECGDLTIERAREFGELPEAEQRAVVAAGKPYRRLSGDGVTKRAAVRSIRVSSPAVAAESIRKTFTHSELEELVQLLSEHLSSAPPSGG